MAAERRDVTPCGYCSAAVFFFCCTFALFLVIVPRQASGHVSLSNIKQREMVRYIKPLTAALFPSWLIVKTLGWTLIIREENN